MEKLNLVGYFANVETTRVHRGYFCNVGRTLTLVILGTLCGLEDIEEIHQWAKSERVSKFLSQEFAIFTIPSIRWIRELMSIIKPESLNELFTRWSRTLLPEFLDGLTISFDGKSIRSTGKMCEYEKPIHILSAHLAEFGITISQKTVDEKSNEIPAMQELLGLIDIRGCIIVADALHGQTKTAEAVINNGGDYLLSIKGNQETLEKDIEDYVQDEKLRAEMKSISTGELNGGRIEKRYAYVTSDTGWMEKHLQNWLGLKCFGAINRRFTTNGNTTNEWHYYISSRNLTPEDLLKYARNEWKIESMHWMLDVHFNEDSCRIRNLNTNQNMNIVRKTAMNYIHNYKNECGIKLPFSRIMFSCLLDCENILRIIDW